MIPRGEDDDCPDSAVWSVTGQNRLPSSKRLLRLLTSNPSVSARSIYLHLYRKDVCLVLERLGATEELEC